MLNPSNLSNNALDLQFFHVEELEERLENRWFRGGGEPTTKTCVLSYTVKNGQMTNVMVQSFPIDQQCPFPRVTFSDSGIESIGEPIELDEQ